MVTRTISNKTYSSIQYFSQLKRSAYLIVVLTKRELNVKYARTILGIGWLILQPLVVVAVYTIFFRNIIKLDTQTISYPSFVLSGLVLWYLFTGIVTKCTYALHESAELITKISFPKIIILISKVLPIILECFILYLMAFLVAIFTHTNLGLNSLVTLIYFAQTTIFAFALGILFSIASLKLRDLTHAIPFFINFAIWLTPVFYPVTLIPSHLKTIFLYGNPLSLSLEGFRNALFYNIGLTLQGAILLALSFVFLIFTMLIFIKFEKKIVENL